MSGCCLHKCIQGEDVTNQVKGEDRVILGGLGEGGTKIGISLL